MTKEQFLQSTISYYNADPAQRRCYSPFVGCAYSPVTANKGLSEGCAIGRHLSTSVQLILDQEEGIAVDSIFVKPRLKKLLPKWMQKFGPDFLRKIQNLHDNRLNWSPTGINRAGITAVNEIIDQFKLDTSKITIPH